MTAADLADELRRHMHDPFPESIEKGVVYGEIEPVMVDADIYGWGLLVSQGCSLSAIDRSRLQQAASELDRSLVAVPADARRYYERLFRIANLALAGS